MGSNAPLKVYYLMAQKTTDRAVKLEMSTLLNSSAKYHEQVQHLIAATVYPIARPLLKAIKQIATEYIISHRAIGLGALLFRAAKYPYFGGWGANGPRPLPTQNQFQKRRIGCVMEGF